MWYLILKQCCLQTSQRLHWCPTLFDSGSLHLPLFMLAPIDNINKVDLRTAHINLLQDNIEIIDRHTTRNILLFKEVQKIKRVKSYLELWIKSL